MGIFNIEWRDLMEEKNRTRKPAQKKRKKNDFLKRIFLVILIVAVLMTSVVAGAFFRLCRQQY